MGIIRDFFKKQVKNERNELAKKYHGEYTKEELMKKAAESVLRKDIKRGAIAVSCALIGMVGINALTSNDKNIDEYKSISATTSDLVKDDFEIQVDEDMASKINEISTSDEALKFIKEMYLEEYNEVNGTSLSLDDIKFLSTYQDYVYDLDGTYITHGARPNTVESKLSKNNIDYDIQEDVRVYSVYSTKTTGESLESFAVKGNEIVDVVLGDEYVYGKEIDSAKNVLADMNLPIIKGIDLVLAMKEEQKDVSISLIKSQLKESIEKYQEQKDKKIAENEIGGR